MLDLLRFQAPVAPAAYIYVPGRMPRQIHPTSQGAIHLQGFGQLVSVPLRVLISQQSRPGGKDRPRPVYPVGRVLPKSSIVVHEVFEKERVEGPLFVQEEEELHPLQNCHACCCWTPVGTHRTHNDLNSYLPLHAVSHVGEKAALTRESSRPLIGM